MEYQDKQMNLNVKCCLLLLVKMVICAYLKRALSFKIGEISTELLNLIERKKKN